MPVQKALGRSSWDPILRWRYLEFLLFPMPHKSMYRLKRIVRRHSLDWRILETTEVPWYGHVENFL